MSNTHSGYASVGNGVGPVRVGDEEYLTSRTNSQNSQGVRTVTVVRTVQGHQNNPPKQGDTSYALQQEQKQTASSTQDVFSKGNEHKDFVLLGSTFPTSIGKYQVDQVSRSEPRESVTEYKTVKNQKSPQLVQTGTRRNYHISGHGGIVLDSGSEINRGVKIVRNNSASYSTYKGLPKNLVNDVDSYAHSYSGGERQGVIGEAQWKVSRDRLHPDDVIQTEGYLKSHSNGSRTDHSQEPVTVQSIHVNLQGVPAEQKTKTVKTTITDKDIRLISAKTEHNLRPVTVQNLRLSTKPADWNTKSDVDDTYLIQNQKAQLVSSKTERERPVIVHNLRLDSTPGVWKQKTVETIPEQVIKRTETRTVQSGVQGSHSVRQSPEQHRTDTHTVQGSYSVRHSPEQRHTDTHTIQVGVQGSHSVRHSPEQRHTDTHTIQVGVQGSHSARQSPEQHRTGKHIVYESVRQSPEQHRHHGIKVTARHSIPNEEEINAGNVQNLRQWFAERTSSSESESELSRSQEKISKLYSQNYDSGRSQDRINKVNSQNYDSGYIVNSTSIPLAPSQHTQKTFVHQNTPSPTSSSKTFKETEIVRRRERRAVRRSSSNSSCDSSADSYNMGNEQQRMAQADVTVEEDAGGNKMIVVEGKNIRVHSENYDTGKKGAKRVVLMPESARPGNKQFQMDTERSVNSYDSYNKRGQKEKVVVLNGRLRESTFTGPTSSVKVANISSPPTVKKEVTETLQHQSSGDSTQHERVTRVNVVNRKISGGSTSEERSIEEGKAPNIRQSILLFEKPHQVQHQRMHMGDKGIAHVRRIHQSQQNHAAPEMIREVIIRPQEAVIAKSEPRREERKVIRVVNSEHLAKSAKGGQIILEKTPPSSTRVVTKRVIVREGSEASQHVPMEQNVQVRETKHVAHLQQRPQPSPKVHTDTNVFNTQYHVQRENPLYAEIPFFATQESHHLVVKKVGETTEEEPHYATVNKVRKQDVKTEIRVKPIIHNGETKLQEINVVDQRVLGRGLEEYGLSALIARQGDVRVERRVVHDAVEGEISETRLMTTESVPAKVERHSKKHYIGLIPVPPDVELPHRDTRTARHLVAENAIRPEYSMREESSLDLSLLDSPKQRRQSGRVTQRVEVDTSTEKSGTASNLTVSANVDSNSVSFSNLTSSLESLKPNEKHSFHWFIPDVSNRSQVHEYESVPPATYRTDLTIGAKPIFDTVDAGRIVMETRARKRPASDSDIKCQAQSVYYINIDDDTPLAVNLEPAENVLELGAGGIYIEDVYPSVEMVEFREYSDGDNDSVKSMYCTEIDLEKNLSCLLPGWRNEEEEDVLKNIDGMDDEDVMDGGYEAPIVKTQRVNDLQVDRGNIFLKNSISSSNIPKFVEVVQDETEENVEAAEADDIANVFDNHFHVERENPLYSSDSEMKEDRVETRNVREQFAPHNMYGLSKHGSSSEQYSGETTHRSGHYDRDTDFHNRFSAERPARGQGYAASYLFGGYERSRKVNTDVNGLVYAIPKAVFKSMSHFERHRVGDGSQSEDVLLNNVRLPDQFFYAYEGNKLRNRSITQGTGLDMVDGEERIEATSSSNVQSERRTSLLEMAESRQARLKPKSDSVRQNVNVDHEEADIKGEPHLHHADGSDANALDLLTFDTVSEDVNLGVKDGVAQVEVKVRCERVSPIEGSFNMWRQSAVIITRLIQIDLEANDERKELYRKICNNELGGQKSITSGPAKRDTYVNGEKILDKKQTFHVYSALMGIADDDEKAALSERRPSKLLSLDSGETEDMVDDVHKYVRRKKSVKTPRSHRKHHGRHHGSESEPRTNTVEMMY